MITQMTLGEVHGNITPPNSRPRRNIKVAPVMVILPNQSIAFSPVTKGVSGTFRSKKKTTTRNDRAEQGTKGQ